MEFLATAEFWVAVSFFLFVGLVVYFGAHKMIASALDNRASAIAKELADAQALREEAEAVLADYKKKTANAAREAEDIIELAAKEAEALALETSRAMTEQFERRMKMAEDKIAQAEADALRDVRAAAADAAVSAAQTVISSSLTPETADKLIGAGIDDLKSKLN
ncbi:ATP F0F1 synthase subunit B [Methyloceanibacter stevinii]|uniref:ATP synthase subunit b n=1 Tax=Methyloceanibacter stevinii TaxID=1774970 RepID=A0A1E3VN04_9HYPH|nr:ATP F0F1 synthase subunit B [Methyloceanibacter stevinii]ODR94913.1 ATP F0F1 synthase subunit B [Methyloceanibacter stevinii]